MSSTMSNFNKALASAREMNEYWLEYGVNFIYKYQTPTNYEAYQLGLEARYGLISLEKARELIGNNKNLLISFEQGWSAADLDLD